MYLLSQGMARINKSLVKKHTNYCETRLDNYIYHCDLDNRVIGNLKYLEFLV